MSSSAFVSEYNKLRNIQLNIEKSDHLLIEHVSKHEDSNIGLFINDLLEIRNRECKTAQAEILNILEPINAIKSKIHEDLNNLNLKSLKIEMITIQNNIQNFKHHTKNQINTLEEQEKILYEDIKNYDAKILDWSKPQIILDKIIKPKFQEKENDAHVCQEVNDYLKFMQENGGHENGWALDDHNLFIKLRYRHKDIYQVTKMLHASLPDISEDDVLAHDVWYTKYLDLKSKQREAIKIWREQKIENKAIAQIEEKEKLPQIKVVEIKRDFNVKEKLAAWKEEKRDKLKKQAEIEHAMQRVRKEMEEKKKLAKEEMKSHINEWKFEKTSTLKAAKAEKELIQLQQKEYRVKMAQKLIKQYQSQDDIFIRKSKEKRNPRIKSVDRISSRNAINVPRDPKRLLQPTEQWLHRTISLDENDSFKKDHKFVCNIRQVAKLGIPAWRRKD